MAPVTRQSKALTSVVKSNNENMANEPAIFVTNWTIFNSLFVFSKNKENPPPMRFNSPPFWAPFDPRWMFNLCLHPHGLTNPDFVSLSLHIYDGPPTVRNFLTEESIKVFCEVELTMNGNEWVPFAIFNGVLQKDGPALECNEFILNKNGLLYTYITNNNNEFFIRCQFKQLGQHQLQKNKNNNNNNVKPLTSSDRVPEIRIHSEGNVQFIKTSHIGIIENFPTKAKCSIKKRKKENLRFKPTILDMEFTPENNLIPIISANIYLHGNWSGCENFISVDFRLKKWKRDFEKAVSRIAICNGETDYHSKVISKLNNFQFLAV